MPMSALANAFFTAVNFLYAAAFGGPMDGTAWEVKVREEGFFNWGSRRDTIVFTKGRLVVAGEVAKGLEPTLYEILDAGGPGTAFAAVLTHPEHGVIEWRGRADGALIEGEILMRAPDGRLKRSRFAGARKS